MKLFDEVEIEKSLFKGLSLFVFNSISKKKQFIFCSVCLHKSLISFLFVSYKPNEEIEL